MAEEDGEETGPNKKVLARDAARAAVPGIYIDSTFTSYWKGHIRITFGERGVFSENGTFWRFAAVMEREDVEKLIKLLQDVFADMDKDESEEAK